MDTQDDLNSVTAEIVRWADLTFPDRTPQSAFLKLFEEIGELIRNPAEPGEYADVLILVLDLASMHGVNPAQAVIDKLTVLHKRKWDVSAMGVYQHKYEDK